MAQSTALLLLPTGEGQVALQAAARILRESREDLPLAERVARALRATGYGPLRSLRVTVQERLVILQGRVPNYYLKQVAQTTVLTVPGAHQVRNDLDVGRAN
jgi:osmotically-inducible protein OsmY